ncbi:putative glycosyltransferase [Candidatus Rhodobacter oscarellae]|uniref:Putative glycosyltransferase n=1 Tax=Candidatus Rhodobacter oscarellae TaxID=1675527 RepID=A0A0J9E105_9RHOB|nr:hypothetical protein [Candidatus Rhodobacter lobularis]KMW56362.1 putative glycosyltransferase [Candidatus Rhodobacter lobularis]
MVATVACIKWGTLFGPEYVNRLYSGVRRNLSGPVRFLCMTENAQGFHGDIEALPLPVEPFAEPMAAALAVANRQGAMRKVSLFRRGVIPDLEGPVLGFDLDVVITGSLDELLDFETGKVAMRHDWVEKRKGRPTGHGSVFRYDPALHGYLYEDLAADAYAEVERARGSEQRYTSHKAMDRGDFAYIPEDWVVSFKHDCYAPWPLSHWVEPRLPEPAKVVCFHGNPKMPQAVEGWRNWRRGCPPTGWLREHWIERAREDLGGDWAGR